MPSAQRSAQTASGERPSLSSLMTRSCSAPRSPRCAPVVGFEPPLLAARLSLAGSGHGRRYGPLLGRWPVSADPTGQLDPRHLRFLDQPAADLLVFVQRRPRVWHLQRSVADLSPIIMTETVHRPLDPALSPEESRTSTCSSRRPAAKPTGLHQPGQLSASSDRMSRHPMAYSTNTQKTLPPTTIHRVAPQYQTHRKRGELFRGLLIDAQVTHGS